jgi:hypothetical protein
MSQQQVPQEQVPQEPEPDSQEPEPDSQEPDSQEPDSQEKDPQEEKKVSKAIEKIQENFNAIRETLEKMNKEQVEKPVTEPAVGGSRRRRGRKSQRRRSTRRRFKGGGKEVNEVNNPIIDNLGNNIRKMMVTVKEMKKDYETENKFPIEEVVVAEKETPGSVEAVAEEVTPKTENKKVARVIPQTVGDEGITPSLAKAYEMNDKITGNNPMRQTKSNSTVGNSSTASPQPTLVKRFTNMLTSNKVVPPDDVKPVNAPDRPIYKNLIVNNPLKNRTTRTVGGKRRRGTRKLVKGRKSRKHGRRRKNRVSKKKI